MRLSLLQWNVLYKENPENIVAQIKILNPDIVCAQELIQNNIDSRLGDTAKYISDQLKYNYLFKIADTWDNRFDKTSQGNAIFSKLPLNETFFEYIQKPKHNPSTGSDEGRVYIEVKLKFGERILTIGTTHLSYSNRFQIDKNRKTEVDNLIKIIKTYKLNYIFTGDLNSIPSSYTIKQVSKYLKNTGPKFNQNTWTTKPFDYQGFKETQLKWRLDYVFATEDIKINSSKVVNTAYSDHLPILVNIEV